MTESVKSKIDSFFRQFPKIELKKGTILIKPEEPLVYIYNLSSGFIKSYTYNESGGILVMNIYKPYNFFPITETLAIKTNPYYFEAVSDSVMYRAPTHKVHEFIRSDLEVLYDLTQRISSGLEGFMIRTQYLIRSNATQKVTSALCLLVRRFGETDSENNLVIQLPQTQSDIADLSGISRETASLELNKLEKQGIITQNKQYFTIHSLDKLNDLSSLYLEDRRLPFSY